MTPASGTVGGGSRRGRRRGERKHEQFRHFWAQALAHMGRSGSGDIQPHARQRPISQNPCAPSSTAIRRAAAPIRTLLSRTPSVKPRSPFAPRYRTKANAAPAPHLRGVPLARRRLGRSEQPPRSSVENHRLVTVQHLVRRQHLLPDHNGPHRTAPDRTTTDRTTAHRTAPDRTEPNRTAPHHSAPDRSVPDHVKTASTTGSARRAG